MRKLPILFVGFLMLSGCADGPGAPFIEASTRPIISEQDRELQIAAQVVMARLRDVDNQANWQSLKLLEPQIYQLAAALLPGGHGVPILARSDVAKAVPHARKEVLLPRSTPVMAHVAAQTHLQSPATLLPPAPIPAPAKVHLANAKPSAPAARPIAMTSAPGHPIAPPPVLSHARSLFLAAQIGSYRSQERALSGWHELASVSPGIFGHLRPRLEQVDLGERGIFYRLKAGPIRSDAELSTLCQALTAKGLSCARSDFTGEDLG